VVAKLTTDDMVAIVAYVSSRPVSADKKEVSSAKR
jgi:hypothetical protein